MRTESACFPRLRTVRHTGLSGLLMLLTMACGPADLRTPEIADGISPDESARGRLLLDELATRYGYERWKQLGTTRAILTDTWPSFLVRTVAMPWSKDAQLMQMTFRNGTDNIHLRFLDGPARGAVWGIQNWATYKQTAGGPLRFEQDDDIHFWLPTTAYFTAAVFRVQEAPTIGYAGTATRGGQEYDLVFATWGDPAPRDNVDHYVLYIHKQSGLLDYLAYTIRDFGKTLKGGMEFADLREVQGVKVPFLMTARGNPEDTPAHQFQLRSIRFGVEVAERTLVPDPARSRSKY